MAHLKYNPGRDSVEYLDAITCGENRLSILDQLLISLRAEIGRPNHQHHLIIGPRGSGKTHLLRLLTAGRIPQDPALRNAYLPISMPEETPLRTPGDLFLKFVEKLAEHLRSPIPDVPAGVARSARGICLAALSAARGMKNAADRFEQMADTLERAAKELDRILLPVAENMDQTFYLGAQRSRKLPLDEHWALRRRLQQMPRLFLIGAAPSMFGAVGDPGMPFYDFFRTHELGELSSDESLEIIRLRLEREGACPSGDGLRRERVCALREHFSEKSPHIRGVLAITGGLPRFIHLMYEVLVETDIEKVIDTLNELLDELTPYFQHRLDPRVVPQPEIDLLHTLALAYGPQQPSELTAALYGVSPNEVSELLSRLQERGLVKRAGRPGGLAVTWDLTEPLYRVWTQFRDNPDGSDLYLLLGRFVALLFTVQEIRQERSMLVEAINAGRRDAAARERILSLADSYHSSLDGNQHLSGMEPSSDSAQTDITAVMGSMEMLLADTKADNPNKMVAALNELRRLQRTTPDDARTIEVLAKGLFNAFNKAGDAADHEQSRALLEELRSLTNAAHTEDGKVRRLLAMGLFNAFNNSCDAKDYEQGLELLEELRQLSAAHVEAGQVHDILAMGLVNAIGHASQSGDFEQGCTFLAELRQLSAAHATDRDVRESLAKGLVNAISGADKAGNYEQGCALLDELYKLSTTHFDDEELRGVLGKGLVNALNAAVRAGDHEQGRTLLENLRQLSADNADDGVVRCELAKGLFNAFNYAGDAGHFEQGRALLEELRQLSYAHPEDEEVRILLAKGLFNAFNYARDAGDYKRGRVLLEELRQVSVAHADAGVVRGELAKGLVNAISYTHSAGDAEQGCALLDELRQLSYAHPEDEEVRISLAKGLFNAFSYAGDAGDYKQGRALLEELRQLSVAHQEDEKVRGVLAKGLFNAFTYANIAGDYEQGYAMLRELRQLSTTYSEDGTVRGELAKVLFNAFNDAARVKDYANSRLLLEELLRIRIADGQEGDDVRDALQRGILSFSIQQIVAMKAGQIAQAEEGVHWLETRLTGDMIALMKPIKLAIDVLKKGEEQALAREPEEMRRVVREVLAMAAKMSEMP